MTQTLSRSPAREHSPPDAGESFFRRTLVFRGTQGGYNLYRCPALVRTARGTLLLSPDARNTTSDWGWIDLLLTRSTDDGLTWSEPQVISRWDGPPRANSNGEALRNRGNSNPAARARPTFNNQTLIPDRDGRVHLIYFVEYQRAMYCVSADDGVSWSDPVDITSSAFDPIRAEYPWRAIATGPGAGIQLRRGTHAGRLIAPAWLASGDSSGKRPGDDHRPSVTATIYSDDGGVTWLPGQISSRDSLQLVNPGEHALVELADGRVLANIRSETSPMHRRAQTISPGGISDWSPLRFIPELWEPVCHAGLTRLIDPATGADVLLFSNPDTEHKPREIWGDVHFCARQNLTIRASFDQGQTWPIKRTIDPGSSGYSCLTVAPDGTIFCAFEHTSDLAWFCTGGVDVSVAAFNLAWLAQGK